VSRVGGKHRDLAYPALGVEHDRGNEADDSACFGDPDLSRTIGEGPPYRLFLILTPVAMETNEYLVTQNLLSRYEHGLPRSKGEIHDRLLVGELILAECGEHGWILAHD
jgi:hypothetical protein